MYNILYEGNCAEVMQEHLPDECIDLTVTSPPYDNLRKYQGFVFPFEEIARQLYRVTKVGGIVVWVVGDQTMNGSETGTSFRHALYFKEIGFNLHDTMIYAKDNPMPGKQPRYCQAFEYMFVFSKGKPLTFHPITEPSLHAGKIQSGNYRQVNGIMKDRNQDKKPAQDLKKKSNIFTYHCGVIKNEHPATFPAKLAEDHILSWSNEGDVVLDPMCGSGTTLAMAVKHNRKCIGIDISAKYLQIAQRRIDDVQS
jgi:site-specific DNA-methyltransferase (adenine-specific)